jgi:outer membrane protein TolC
LAVDDASLLGLEVVLRGGVRADARDAATLEVDALRLSGLPSSKSFAHLAAQGYEAGRLSLIERLDAERALLQTQELLVAARLRLRQSEARVVAVAHDAGRVEASQDSSTER